MLSEQTEFSVAWMVYRLYETGLWPLGTFSVPIGLINYGLDRRRQAKSERPASRANSAFVVTLLILVVMFALYYTGFGISSVLT